MTNEEAYYDIVNYLGNGCHNGENALSFSTLTTALEAIGKQLPKKPKTEKKTVDLGNGYSVKIVEIHRCPECGKTIMKGYRCYGLDCGQKIDWSDYE